MAGAGAIILIGLAVLMFSALFALFAGHFITAADDQERRATEEGMGLDHHVVPQ